MPTITRWFRVTHDINSDPEIWELREKFGDRAGFVWLECLSIADRNNGKVGPNSPQLHAVLASKCRVYSPKVRAIFAWCLGKGWLVDRGDLYIAKWAKYNNRRETAQLPSETSPSETSPSNTSEDKKPGSASGGALDLRFKKFWNSYPNHECSELEAWQEWQKEAHLSAEVQDAIIAALAKPTGKYPPAAVWLREHRWERRQLDPKIKSITDRLYISDRKKFDRLIVWVKQAQEQKYRDPVIIAALSDFERYAPTVVDWWPYLDRIINRVEKDMNAKESLQQSERHKAELKEFYAEKTVG